MCVVFFHGMDCIHSGTFLVKYVLGPKLTDVTFLNMLVIHAFFFFCLVAFTLFYLQ